MWLDYDDKYAVSEEGLVMHKKSGRISKGTLRKSGYYQSATKINCKMYFRLVHRMVGELFLPKIDIPGLVIDHINRDKKDNRACNLRWVSISVNIRNTNVKTNTGERYISLTPAGTYKLFSTTQGMYMNKRYNTLQEAIAARDNILADYINPL